MCGKLERQLRGDIDAIVLKALRPDPLSRYSSVADFEADVQRHLDGLPVLARHGSALYKGRRFASRHRVALIAGFAVLRDRGEYAAAEVVAREVVARLRASYPEETLRNAHQELNLGRVLAEQGKHDEAEKLLRYVVDLYATEFDEENMRLVGARAALARCLELQGSG